MIRLAILSPDSPESFWMTLTLRVKRTIEPWMSFFIVMPPLPIGGMRKKKNGCCGISRQGGISR